MIDITLPLMEYRLDVAEAERRAERRRIVAEDDGPAGKHRGTHRRALPRRRARLLARAAQASPIGVWARPIGRHAALTPVCH